MKALSIIALLTLAACGADGEPITPVARADISISSSGVHTATQVAVKQGPLSITFGF